MTRIQIFVLAILGFVGCKTVLMPTPVSWQGRNVDALAALAEKDRTTTTRVFVFTDREPSGEHSPAEIYSDERSRRGRLAVATVDLAKGMDWDALYRATFLESRPKSPESQLLEVEEFGVLWTTVPPAPARLVREPKVEPEERKPADRFTRAVNEALADSKQPDVFIFVHGYNTKFDHNLMIAGQLHHYLGRQGVFVNYAWPSRGSLLGYGADKANAAYSIRLFRLFLGYLAEETKARRIHILAHSAGAPVAVGALQQLRLIHYEESDREVRERYRIGQLVLAAPDLDLDLYVNAMLDGLEDLPERVTIYVSEDDRALRFSGFLFDNVRLGEMLEGLKPEQIAAGRKAARLDVIDVTYAEDEEGSFLGHSYFHENPWVSSDLLMIFRHGVPAKARGLTRGEKEMAFRFPEDYPERVKVIAAELERKKEADR